MNDKMNWKNVLTIGGAYTAYCIGAGFASGQETLQYYASWGGILSLRPAGADVCADVCHLLRDV